MQIVICPYNCRTILVSSLVVTYKYSVTSQAFVCTWVIHGGHEFSYNHICSDPTSSTIVDDEVSHQPIPYFDVSFVTDISFNLGPLTRFLLRITKLFYCIYSLISFVLIDNFHQFPHLLLAEMQYCSSFSSFMSPFFLFWFCGYSKKKLLLLSCL